MKVYVNPQRKEWPALTARPAMDTALLYEQVKGILNEVKEGGDEAIKKYSLQFDGISPQQLMVSEAEIEKAASLISPALKEAIQIATSNIRLFHEKQCETTELIGTMPGITCWRKSIAIEKVGLYIPGGTAPLFSTVLMLGIPAKIAGCKEIVLCTPPASIAKTGRASEPGIHPAILFAAKLVGINKIYRAGGIQAIAAMAYGTQTIPAVYKIFGPGNQYVNAAKQLVQLDGIAIDMPAGPSEVCVLADDSCVPAFVAADLLSQAEHGIDSQVILVCTSEMIVASVQEEMKKQLGELSRRDTIEQVLLNSNAVVFNDLNEAIQLVNAYAPEHLIIACASAEAIAEQVVNAGSVFLGNYSPESAGDYASGTNHTLPTNGHARNYSGVSVDSFVKKVTFQQITRDGLRLIATAVEQMASAEGLEAHKKAVSIRLKS